MRANVEQTSKLPCRILAKIATQSGTNVRLDRTNMAPEDESRDGDQGWIDEYRVESSYLDMDSGQVWHCIRENCPLERGQVVTAVLDETQHLHIAKQVTSCIVAGGVIEKKLGPWILTNMSAKQSRFEVGLEPLVPLTTVPVDLIDLNSELNSVVMENRAIGVLQHQGQTVVDIGRDYRLVQYFGPVCGTTLRLTGLRICGWTVHTRSAGTRDIASIVFQLAFIGQAPQAIALSRSR